MRFRLCYEAAFLIAVLFSATVSAATYTKTVTMPPAGTVLSSGTPNLAANILEVGMSGVEYIPAASSESRAVAAVSKGLRIPTSGIISSLKTGLRGGVPALLGSAVVAGIVEGVGWIQGEGGQIQKPGSSADPVPTAPGQYRWMSHPNSGATEATSAAESCKEIAKYLFPPRGVGLVERIQNNGSTASCYWADPNNSSNIQYYATSRVGNGCPANSSYSTTVGACIGSGVPVPVSEEDLSVLDGFILGKDGVWQQGLANEVCKGSSDVSGCIANMGAQPYISGPSLVSTPEVTTETTSQNPDGTSTEVSTKTRTDYQLGYPSSAPGTISVDPKTTTQTTTTTKDANGTTISTGTKTDTTTTTQPGSGTQLADGVFTDTPFPEVSPFYTQKFPGGFKDVWEKNKATFDSSALVSFLKSFVPSFSGSCPSWSMSFDIMPHANFGSREFGSLCYIFAVIKVIMLVTAMFTCRAIIFGG